MQLATMIVLLAAGLAMADAAGSASVAAEKCGALCHAKGALNTISEFSILPVAMAAPEDTVEAAAEEVKIHAGETAEAVGKTGDSAAKVAKGKASEAADAAGQEAQDAAAAAAEKGKQAAAAANEKGQQAAAAATEKGQEAAAASKQAIIDAANAAKKKTGEMYDAAKAKVAPEPTMADKAREYYRQASNSVSDAYLRVMKATGMDKAADKVKQEL